MAYGELVKEAEEILTRVRRGEVIGYLPSRGLRAVRSPVKGRFPPSRAWKK
jgi:hypothetical protein